MRWPCGCIMSSPAASGAFTYICPDCQEAMKHGLPPGVNEPEKMPEKALIKHVKRLEAFRSKVLEAEADLELSYIKEAENASPLRRSADR